MHIVYYPFKRSAFNLLHCNIFSIWVLGFCLAWGLCWLLCWLFQPQVEARRTQPWACLPSLPGPGPSHSVNAVDALRTLECTYLTWISVLRSKLGSSSAPWDPCSRPGLSNLTSLSPIHGPYHRHPSPTPGSFFPLSVPHLRRWQATLPFSCLGQQHSC